MLSSVNRYETEMHKAVSSVWHGLKNLREKGPIRLFLIRRSVSGDFSLTCQRLSSDIELTTVHIVI